VYHNIFKFEKELSDFTGAPFVISTDCCTHALEICLRIIKPKKIISSAFTYLSVPMTFKKLNIDFTLTDESWIGEYQLGSTKIWDSARLLKPNMYRRGNLQCLSFGNGKPLDNKRGGAILCDDQSFYKIAKQMAFDGRDLSIDPWINQKQFKIGYHYNMAVEHAINCSKLLKKYIKKKNYQPQKITYPDCRQITFLD
jgi:dTDP-4-amino-4,6-dideoxygalactose transaminase